MGGRVYVGGLPTTITERELEDEFNRFGTLRSVWVARKPPGFAFIEFDDQRDADDAVRRMDGHQGWRVEFSRKGERRPPPGGGGGGGYGDRGPPRGGGGGRSDQKCYECGEPGHLARDCRMRNGGGGGGGGGGGRYRDRSRSPVRRRSPSYEPRDRRRSPSYGRSVSRSPRRSRSPVRKSRSPVARKSRSPVRKSRSPSRD